MSSRVCINLQKNKFNDSMSCELKSNSTINEAIKRAHIELCVKSSRKCEDLPEFYEEIQSELNFMTKNGVKKSEIKSIMFI